MLRHRRGRRTIARIAQLAAIAVSAVAVLSAVSHAADTGAANGRLVGGAGAGTINGALIDAYRNNPQLNASALPLAPSTRTYPPRFPAIARA
jgi:hypothetical protein